MSSTEFNTHNRVTVGGCYDKARFLIDYINFMTAGMPFLLPIDSAPNAIAYSAYQFTAGEFFKFGVNASLVLMLMVCLAVTIIWPLTGMPILLN